MLETQTVPTIVGALVLFLLLGATGTMLACRPDLGKNRGAGIRGVILMWVLSIPASLSILFLERLNLWWTVGATFGMSFWIAGAVAVLFWPDPRFKKAGKKLMRRMALS